MIGHATALLRTLHEPSGSSHGVESVGYAWGKEQEVYIEAASVPLHTEIHRMKVRDYAMFDASHIHVPKDIFTVCIQTTNGIVQPSH